MLYVCLKVDTILSDVKSCQIAIIAFLGSAVNFFSILGKLFSDLDKSKNAWPADATQKFRQIL